MRKRRAYITFPQENGDSVELLALQKKLDGLNIRFSVQIYTQNGMPANANIEIYNLNREDLDYLSTIARTYLKKNHMFQLYAGYEDDMNMLFSGMALEAIPDGYPDVVLRISGMSNIKYWGETMNLQKSNVKVMDLIDEAAKQMNYTVNIDNNLRNNNALLNKTKDEFSFTGSPMDLLEEAQNMMGGITSDPQTVFVSVYNDQINVWSPSVANANKKLIISKDTGMIGLPKATQTGCQVKILMNTGIKTGDVVEVRSERIKILNGEYYVIGVSHDGELRGNTWETTLDCALVSNFKANVNAK